MHTFYLALLCLIMTTPAHADTAATQDYWVAAQIDAFVRSSESDAWKPRYSAPFGVRTGYGTGIILTDRTNTDPAVPNCYSFTFTAQSADPQSLVEEIEVVEYRGDNFCGNLDPSKTIHLATIDLKAEQGETTHLQFPFLDGEEVRFDLKQDWKPVSANY